MNEWARMIRLGIKQADWLWSGACRLDGHQAANGQRFEVRSGLMIGQRRTMPGQDKGCSCVGTAVVVGF
jgi:hypothetical protein